MRKWDPPFLTHVSVSYEDDESAEVAAKASTTTNEADPTFKAASCTFGFLFPIRFFRDLIASLGWTLFDRMTSEISRVSARSSLIMCCISLLRSRVDHEKHEWDNLQAGRRGALDLLVERRVGGEPAGHDAWSSLGLSRPLLTPSRELNDVHTACCRYLGVLKRTDLYQAAAYATTLPTEAGSVIHSTSCWS